MSSGGSQPSLSVSTLTTTLSSWWVGSGGQVTAHLLMASSFLLLSYIYIYAFSRRFYPKRLTVHSGYTCFITMCVPWESNPQAFALLTQCSTTEPQENLLLLHIQLAQPPLPSYEQRVSCSSRPCLKLTSAAILIGQESLYSLFSPETAMHAILVFTLLN